MRILELIRDDFYSWNYGARRLLEVEFEIHCSREIDRLINKELVDMFSKSIVIGYGYTDPSQFKKFVLAGLPPMTIIVDRENGYYFKKIGDDIKPENMDMCRHFL